MPLPKTESVELRKDEDVVRARQAVRRLAEECRFTLVDQTKLVTAASELARNTVIHGGGGVMRLEVLSEGLRTGLRLVFEDQGPGIPDIDMALRDGFTTGSGLGLGLGGAKRLVNEFQLLSKPGMGTRISATRWK
jgi:serine/threonine-protein kinase RsbT